MTAPKLANLYGRPFKIHVNQNHGHIVINSMGVITTAILASAKIDERDVCPERVEKIKGL